MVGGDGLYAKHKEMLQINSALEAHMTRSGIKDRFVGHLARQLIVSSNIIATQCLETQRYAWALKVLKPALRVLDMRELQLNERANLEALTNKNLGDLRASIGVDSNGKWTGGS